MLGCGEHVVVLQERGGSSVLTEIPWASLSYSRRLDEMSEASVTVGDLGKASDSCCAALASIVPFVHELAIYRDGTLVWVGVPGNIKVTRDAMVIPARDLFIWFERRVLPNDQTFTSSDYGSMFTTLATQALAVDNSMGISTAGVPLVGVTGDRTVRAVDHVRAADALREIGRVAVDWTMDLRVLRGVDPGAGVGMVLDDADLIDPELEIAGLALASRAFVLGASSPGTNTPVVGSATAAVGGPDPGVVQHVIRDQNITSSADATLAALSYLKALQATPLQLTARLSPESGVGFGRLVPGVLTQVATDLACYTVAQNLRLLGVQVSDSPSEGESVSVTLGPVGTTEVGA